MADCAAIPSCAHLQFKKISRTTFFMPRNLSLRIMESFFGKCKLDDLFPSWKVHVATSPLYTALDGSLCLKGSSLRCCCLGILTNPESVGPLNWVPVVDQVLLITSVVFAYMAGVIPQERTFPGARNNSTDQDSGAVNSTSYGRTTKSDSGTNSEDSWGEVKGKLAEALDAIEHDSNLDDRVVECESYSNKRPLNLFVVTECPRWRLLWATLQQLHKEVNDISQTHEVVNRDIWLGISSEVIQGSIQPIFIKWLKEEIALKFEEQDTNFVARLFDKLKGDDTIVQNIKRVGKSDLYADLLFFLRFGSLRNGCCYDRKFLTMHGIDILEDLVITLADGITSIYLELISVDSSMSSEMNGLGLTLCSLSTRGLQRLRNEVALNQWLQQNFESIVSMYEDRFELFVFRKQELEDPIECNSEKLKWWKKLAFKKPAAFSPSHYYQISSYSMPIKRTKELRALTGWRYFFSLFLEFSDITMPLVRVVFTKVIRLCSS